MSELVNKQGKSDDNDDKEDKIVFKKGMCFFSTNAFILESNSYWYLCTGIHCLGCNCKWDAKVSGGGRRRRDADFDDKDDCGGEVKDPKVQLTTEFGCN